MINLSTNLTALNIQRSLLNSTKLLNKAIERLSTGFKVNRASDNAANFNIIQQMNTQISSLDIAEDNVAMGIDMISTANEVADMINDRLTRLRALAAQAENKTYGKESLDAINTECNALIDEIDRLYKNAEYNGIKLYGLEVTDDPAQAIMTYSTRMLTAATVEVTADTSTLLKELGIEESSFSVLDKSGTEIIAYDTESTDTLGDVFNVLSEYGITSSIVDGVITMTSDNGNHVSGDLIEKLGINIDSNIAIDSSAQNSMQSVSYTLTLTASESTTLAELGALSSGKLSMTVNDKYGDKEGNVTVNSSMTLGEMFNELSRFDIQGSITDGCITLESASGNYVVDNSVMSALGITNEIGTSDVTSGVTNTSTTPVTYTETTTEGGYTYTTTIEQTNTIWTTTTTSTTETQTVWTTTTIETTQTSTIEETTTIPVVTTVTVYTTTTIPETVTETIFVTNTSTATVGNTVSSTVPVTYESITTTTTVTENSTSVGKVVTSSAPITYTSTVIEKVTTSSATNGVAMTSSAAVTYTTTEAVNENTKLSDFLDLSDTSFDERNPIGNVYATHYLSDLISRGLADSVENLTLGDLFEYLTGLGVFSCSVDNGVISIKDRATNNPTWYLTGSIFDQMGITATVDQGGTRYQMATLTSTATVTACCALDDEAGSTSSATLSTYLKYAFFQGYSSPITEDSIISISGAGSYEGTIADFICDYSGSYLGTFDTMTIGSLVTALEEWSSIESPGGSFEISEDYGLIFISNAEAFEIYVDGVCLVDYEENKDVMIECYTKDLAEDSLLLGLGDGLWWTNEDENGNEFLAGEIELTRYNTSTNTQEYVTLTVDVTSTTVGDFADILEGYGIDLSINNGKATFTQNGDWVIAYNGWNIEEAFGISNYGDIYLGTSDYHTTVSVSPTATMSDSNKLSAEAQNLATMNSTLAELGYINEGGAADADAGELVTGINYDSLILSDKTNSANQVSIQYNSNMTLQELADELSAYDISLTVSDGKVTLTPSGNYYISDLGSVADNLNLATSAYTVTSTTTTTTVDTTQTDYSTTTTYTTSAITMTSTSGITFQREMAVSEDTKLSDFLDLSDTSFEGAPASEGGEDYSYSYFDYELEYIVDEGLADSIENITLGDLFEYISNDGFIGSVSADGVITITSNDPMYYLTGSIFDQMGITANVIPAGTHLTQEEIISDEEVYIQSSSGYGTSLAVEGTSRLQDVWALGGYGTYGKKTYEANDYIQVELCVNNRYEELFVGTMSDFMAEYASNTKNYEEYTYQDYVNALQACYNTYSSLLKITGSTIGSDGVVTFDVTNNSSSTYEFFTYFGENEDDGYEFSTTNYIGANTSGTIKSIGAYQNVNYVGEITYITALTDCSVDNWYTDDSGNKYSEIYLSYYDAESESSEYVTITYNTTATIGTLKNLFAEYDLELSIGSSGKIYLEQKGEYVYDGYGGADIEYGFKWHNYSWDYAETDAYATMSSSNKLIAESTCVLDYGYSMSDMGFIPATYVDEETGKFYDEIIINDITNSTSGFAIRYYSDTTFTELQNELANYGIDLSFLAGNVSITSTGNYYIQDLGSLAEEINMDGQIGYTVTATATTAAISTTTTNLVTKTISNDTTLEELGLDKNKTYVVEYDLITISIAGTKTVGELVNAMKQATPTGIDSLNGMFTMYSSQNNGGPVLKSIDSELAQALNLSSDINDYFDVTTTSTTATVTTTTTLTMTEDTTFAELGWDDYLEPGLEVMTIVDWETGNTTSVWVSSDDTIKDFIQNLNESFGVTASVSNGIFTLENSSNCKFQIIDGIFANVLNIAVSPSEYQTTSVTTTTTSTTSTSTIYTTETIASTETNTVFETVTGGDVLITTIQETQTTFEETTTTVWTTTTTSTTETETITTEYTVPETSTTVLKTMTVATTLQDLGVNNETYITVQKGATQTIITVASSDTINQLKSKLASVGINSSVSRGKLTLSPISESNYIIGASDELEAALGLNENYYTVESGLEMSDSPLLQYQRVYVMNEASQLSEYGVTDGNIYVIKDGEAYGTIYVSSSESVQSILNDISSYGFTTSIKNGNVSIKGNGNIFLSETDSVIAMMSLGDDSSNLLSVFNIGNVVQTESVVYSNTPSNTLLPQTVSPEPYYQAVDSINIQAGINSDSSNQIKVSTGFVLEELETLRNIGKNTVTKHDYLSLLDDMISTVSAKQVEYGAAINRLESAFEEITIRYDNLVSSRSTLRDADVSEESSNLIKYQILQQAGATLIATANQTPSIALRLL